MCSFHGSVILLFSLYVPSLPAITQPLDVPFKAQVPPPQPFSWKKTHNCGQTSVLMVLSKYAGHAPTAQDIMDIDDFIQMRFGDPVNEYYGSFTGGTKTNRLTTVATDFDHGLGRFPDTHSYTGWTIDQLKTELNNGHPVIVGVWTDMSVGHNKAGKKTVPHWMVLTGITDIVYVNDPGHTAGKNNQYTMDDFTAAWNDQGNTVVVIHPNAPTNGNGWRMSGYNSSRINSSPVAGPATQPTFQTVIPNTAGTLSRIAKDGSLVLFDGTNLSYFTSGGGFKWSKAVGGVSDIAIGPSGTIYTSTPASVSAWNPADGQPVWASPYAVNTGNETDSLVIDSAGTIYIVTGASYLGPPNKVTAINSNGTLKWEIGASFRGYSQFVLSTDESAGYFLDLMNSFGGVVSWERGVSTATGQDLYGATFLPRGNTHAFAPWGTLYTAGSNGFSDFLLGYTATLSCNPVPGGPYGVATLLPQGTIVSLRLDGKFMANDKSGTQLWVASVLSQKSA